MPDPDHLAADIADRVICDCAECGARAHLASHVKAAILGKRRRPPRKPYFNARDRFLAPHERAFGKMLKGVWAEEKRVILANMRRNPLPKAYAGTRTKQDNNLFIDSWLYPKTLIEKEIKAKSARLLLQLMAAGMERTIAEYALDITFELVNARAVTWLETQTPTLSKNLAQIDYERVREQLLEGFNAGEGMDKLAKRVNATFEEFDANRAEMIARTETIRASNEGNVEVFKEAGFEKLVWFANPNACSRVDRPNADITCNELDNETTPIDEPFFAPNEWSTGFAPPLHPNCRCSVAPWSEEWGE